MATGQRTEEIFCISSAVYSRAETMLFWGETKNGLPHSVPLPHQAVEILQSIDPNEHGLYFPHARRANEHARYSSVVHVIYRFLAETKMSPFTARDLRRTWKTLAGQAGISKEMRDRLQNHARRSDVSSRHYDRYDYLAEKRAAMAKWAAYLDLIIEGKVDESGTTTADVVHIGKEAAA